MKIEAPPQRYRIVERDRRLQVVDTWAQSGPAPVFPSQPAGPPPGMKRLNFGGSAELTTQPLYDLKAPRTLMLDPGAAAIVSRVKLTLVALVFIFVLVAIWQPALLALLALAFQPKLWKGLKARSSDWLDQFEQKAGRPDDFTPPPPPPTSDNRYTPPPRGCTTSSCRRR